MGSEGVNRRAG